MGKKQLRCGLALAQKITGVSLLNVRKSIHGRRTCTTTADVVNNISLLFAVYLMQVSHGIALNILAFIPAAIIGVIGGLLGAMFTFINLKVGLCSSLERYR